MQLTALDGVGDVVAGDDIAQIIATSLGTIRLAAQDVIVVAQKIVSKAEWRRVDLADVSPSPAALDLARTTGKDPRLVELILREAREVVRAVPGVLIVRHRLGLVMANAGIDQSNLSRDTPGEPVLLLPVDPDASARAIRDGLRALTGVAPAVVISDSFGRPWRLGSVNVAIGVAGLPALLDRRGEPDRYGRRLEATEVALADAVAAAAGLAMGEGAEGRPVVHLRGLSWPESDAGSAPLLRATGQDLFR